MEKKKVLLRCIDASGKPADIPLTHWVKEGECYTAVGAGKGGNCFYFILEEIDLTTFFPYKGFATSRFEEV